MEDVNKQVLQSAVRSLLIALGMYLADHKYIPADSVNELVGALLIVGPALWGIIDKYVAMAKSARLQAHAINVGIAVANADPGRFTPAVSEEEAPRVLAAVAPAAP